MFGILMCVNLVTVIPVTLKIIGEKLAKQSKGDSDVLIKENEEKEESMETSASENHE